MNLGRKNRKRTRFLKSGKSAYLCPIKDCKHESKWFSDLGSLFEHLLGNHSSAEIENKFKLKNIRIDNKKDNDAFSLPHDIVIYVDNMVNEIITIDEDENCDSTIEQINRAINQVINTNSAFGLNHSETVIISNHTTHLKLTS